MNKPNQCKVDRAHFVPNLVAVLAQSLLNLGFHTFGKRGCASQIAATFFVEAKRQVAGARLAMHRLARSGQSESLLRSLVGLHLGHLGAPNTAWFSPNLLAGGFDETLF